MSAGREELREAAVLLRRAERPVRVLRAIAWPENAAQDFFARGEHELPRVTYAPLDPRPVLEGVAAARARLKGSSPVHAWLARTADRVEGAAHMLAAAGTPDFHRWSVELYGAPRTPLADGASTALELARTLDAALADLSGCDLGRCELPVASADDVAIALREAGAERFGAEAPAVEVVEHLSANALAGPQRIRVRRGARFSDKDVAQLVHHEAFVHVATSLNGHAQEHFPILEAGHPGTTRTQEGLAVFAELITGSTDPDRMRRLADRTLAIQMAIDGADFLDLYRWFRDRTPTREQAFECARRVVRGGTLEGGAPFTKDGVYLEGLLRVHDFLRSVVALNRVDCLRMLFCGKLDLEDVPALCELAAEGWVVEPRFLPPWVADLRFLVAYLAYSSFLNRVALPKVREHYREMLARTPRVAAVG